MKIWVWGWLAFFLAGIARADIYTYTDERGIIHFSNIPDDPRYRPYRSPRDIEARHVKPSASLKKRRQRYASLVEEAARRYGLEPPLLDALICVESAYHPRAVSPKGARGLMQLMPETARRYGVRDPFDVVQNLHGGARHLKDLLEAFDGDIRLAIAAYNAGERAVRRYGGIPPFPETRRHVVKVMALYSRYRRLALAQNSE